MAYMFKPQTSKTVFYATERCEETILINFYNKVHKFVPPDQRWYDDFQNAFFEQGLPVNPRHIESLNAVAKRRGIDPVEFKSTRQTDWNREVRAADRAAFRRTMLEKIRSLTDKQLADLLDRADLEMELLEPMPRPEEREHFRDPQQLTPEEARRRYEAINTNPTNTPEATTPPAEPTVSVPLPVVQPLAELPERVEGMDSVLQTILANQQTIMDNQQTILSEQKAVRNLLRQLLLDRIENS